MFPYSLLRSFLYIQFTPNFRKFSPLKTERTCGETEIML